jgi:hypothetical protein
MSEHTSVTNMKFNHASSDVKGSETMRRIDQYDVETDNFLQLFIV